MSEREQFLRRFHAAHPGATSRALARTGCYERFAARSLSRLSHDARILDLVCGEGISGAPSRVLDLACGDGALLAHLPASAIGLDISFDDLRAARTLLAPRPTAGGLDVATLRVVQGRAQALPFADRAFDLVTCHLAFMLFDDIERVVAELARVLAPGGRFAALLGGGPTAGGPSAGDPSAGGDDAFHRFLDLLASGGTLPSAAATPMPSAAATPLPSAAATPLPSGAVTPLRFGDRRASSEAGWRALFAGWGDITFERWELDASGSFEEVWAFLGASYQLPASSSPSIRAQLAAAFPGPRVPCRIVTWYADVRAPRPGAGLGVS